MQKGIASAYILIGTLVIIVIIGGVLYLGKQTVLKPSPVSAPIISDEINDWKSYIDQSNGFSVKYPPEWREESSVWSNNLIDSMNLAYDTQVILTLDKPCLNDVGCGGRKRGIYINILRNDKNLTSKEYVAKYILTDGQPYSGKMITNQPIYFSSINAIIVDGLPGSGNPGLVAYIKNKDNQIIELFSDGLDAEIVNQIFSTFQFTP